MNERTHKGHCRRRTVKTDNARLGTTSVNGHINLQQARSTFTRIATAYVTPFGWFIAAAGLLCLALFAWLGWYELLAIGAAALAMVLCGIMMSLGNVTFQSTLHLSENRVTTGQNITADLTVTNSGKAPTTTVWGDLPIGNLHERFRIPALTVANSTTLNLEFTAHRRAVLTVGPLHVRRGDPFGMVRHERSMEGQNMVYIHPKTVPLNTLESGIVRDLEGTPSGQIVDDDLDFYGLREYHDGDDIRNVHWLSSAKTGTMMIRQYEATKRTDTTLGLDTNTGAYTSAAEFELAVSSLASVGVQCLKQHRPLTLYANPKQSAPTQPLELLDWCSFIEPSRSADHDLLIDVPANSTAASFYLLVTGPLTSVDSLRRIASTLPTSASTVILQVSTKTERALRRYDEFTLATISNLNDLQLVMGALS